VSAKSMRSPAWGPSGTTRFSAAQAEGVIGVGGARATASAPATTDSAERV
jgi:hypothetical protein